MDMGNPRVREHLVKSTIQGALLLVLVFPIAARAASKGDVRNVIHSVNRLFESLEYDHALHQIQLARQLVRGTGEEVTLSLYEGVILCEMSRLEEGAASFKAALLLRPDAKLPVQVAPKVAALFQTLQQRAKSELAALAARREAETARAPRVEAPPRPALSLALAPPTVSSGAPRREVLRRRSLIPALAGGALAVGGGLSWTLSRGELDRLRNDDPRLATTDDVQRSMSRGRTLQTLGIGLLGAGAVGLATAAGMYMLGAPEQPLALGVSTDGTSAFVHGRWP
jgi:hypothetical protein